MGRRGESDHLLDPDLRDPDWSDLDESGRGQNNDDHYLGHLLRENGHRHSYWHCLACHRSRTTTRAG